MSKTMDNGSLSPLDRIEFALRDAGFDYDEAFRIAHMATNAKVCEYHDQLRGKPAEQGQRPAPFAYTRATEPKYPLQIISPAELEGLVKQGHGKGFRPLYLGAAPQLQVPDLTDDFIDDILFYSLDEDECGEGDKTCMLIDAMGCGTTEKLPYARRLLRGCLKAALSPKPEAS